MLIPTRVVKNLPFLLAAVTPAPAHIQIIQLTELSKIVMDPLKCVAGIMQMVFVEKKSTTLTLRKKLVVEKPMI